jgi:hypothetical protein
MPLDSGRNYLFSHRIYGLAIESSGLLMPKVLTNAQKEQISLMIRLSEISAI